MTIHYSITAELGRQRRDDISAAVAACHRLAPKQQRRSWQALGIAKAIASAHVAHPDGRRINWPYVSPSAHRT